LRRFFQKKIAKGSESTNGLVILTAKQSFANLQRRHHHHELRRPLQKASQSAIGQKKIKKMAGVRKNTATHPASGDPFGNAEKKL
jgi:hypothetical protein